MNMDASGDNFKESNYKNLLQEIEYLQEYIDDLLRESNELGNSLEDLLLERYEHHEQYYNKLKLQYNEAVLTRNVFRQMDLALALSKAQEINLKISADISQKHKLVKILSKEKDLMSKRFQKLVEDVRSFMLANGKDAKK